MRIWQRELGLAYLKKERKIRMTKFREKEDKQKEGKVRYEKYSFFFFLIF